MRERVQLDRDLLPHLDLGNVAFGHAKIELDGPDVVQAHDIVALLEISTRAHQAQADDPRERRVDFRLRQARVDLFLDRDGALVVVLGDVVRVLADELLVQQLLGALQPLLVGAHLRLGRRQLRAHLRGVQRHELRPARHRLALLKVQLEQASVDLRPDNDRFLGQQAAHGRDLVRHGADLHRRGLDRQPLGRAGGSGAAPPALRQRAWAARPRRGGGLIVLLATGGQHGDDDQRRYKRYSRNNCLVQGSTSVGMPSPGAGQRISGRRVPKVG